jgi:carboxyl-terminal processing protease
MKSARRYIFLLAALILPIAFAGAHPAQRLLAQGNEAASKKKLTDDFLNALSVINNNYAGKVETETVVKSSIIGMLHTLDPHSSFLDRKEFESFLNDQRSRYTGIGSWIAQREGKVFITSPFPGTPAHRAGIRYGDQIIEVNGESTQGMISRQVSEKLLGPEGTPVTVKVARAGVSQPLEFKMVREGVSHPSIPNYYLFPGGVGYINLERGFNTTTFDEMREAIRDLKQQGMNSLVLDLRDNRGGLVNQAWKVANLFLYRGQKIVSMRGRPGVLAPVDQAAQNTTPEDYPLVVLINAGSASASEIVAGAFQDHDRARLVGDESFGKALVQHVYRLQDGAGLTLTIGNYFTPSGRMIQREYAGRSFYDYYLRRGDKEAVEKNDGKQTDSGRKVYEGGGIEPDVKVKIPQKEF